MLFRSFVEYPEDIRMYGVSFNTTIAPWGLAVQGEVSYRDNAPLQFDDIELLFTVLSPLNPLIPAEYNRFISQLGTVGPGEEVRGWERHEVSQWQMTLTKVFANVLGAEQLSLVGEFGGTKVWDLPPQSVLRYQGDGTDTGGGPDVLTGAGRNPITQTYGFPTSYSWGYRLAARADLIQRLDVELLLVAEGAVEARAVQARRRREITARGRLKRQARLYGTRSRCRLGSGSRKPSLDPCLRGSLFGAVCGVLGETGEESHRFVTLGVPRAACLGIGEGRVDDLLQDLDLGTRIAEPIGRPYSVQSPAEPF